MPVATRKQSVMERQPSPSKSTAVKKSKATSKTAGGAKTKRQFAIDKLVEEQEQGDQSNDDDRVSEEAEADAETATILPKTNQFKKPGRAAESMKPLGKGLYSVKSSEGPTRNSDALHKVPSLPDLGTFNSSRSTFGDITGPFQTLGKHLDNFTRTVEVADTIRADAAKIQQNHAVLLRHMTNLKYQIDEYVSNPIPITVWRYTNLRIARLHHSNGKLQSDTAWIKKSLIGTANYLESKDAVSQDTDDLHTGAQIPSDGKKSLAKDSRSVAQKPPPLPKRSHDDVCPDEDDAENREGHQSPIKRQQTSHQPRAPIEINDSSALSDPARTSFLDHQQDQFSSPPQDESLNDYSVPNEEMASEDSAATKDAEDVGDGSVLVAQSA